MTDALLLGASGVVAQHASQISLHHCLVRQGLGPAIDVSDSARLTLIHTTLDACEGGLWLWDQASATVVGDASWGEGHSPFYATTKPTSPSPPPTNSTRTATAPRRQRHNSRPRSPPPDRHESPGRTRWRSWGKMGWSWTDLGPTLVQVDGRNAEPRRSRWGTRVLSGRHPRTDPIGPRTWNLSCTDLIPSAEPDVPPTSQPGIPT